MRKIILWAQRLENDDNDYVYESSDYENLKAVVDFQKKSDLIYEASKMLDKQFKKRAINVGIKENNIQIYYDDPPIKKIYISLTIGIDPVGRKSPVFFFMEDGDGIDFVNKDKRSIIFKSLNTFAESIGRSLDDNTKKMIEQGLTKLCNKVSRKKSLPILITIGSTLLIVAIATIFKIMSK